MKNIQKALCLMLVLCLTLVAGAALAQDYTATEKGFGGDVTVTLTIENNEIVAAKAEGASETDGIGSKAIESMPAAMVEQNSVTVDRKNRVIRHELVMDETSSVLEYTQIYTARIVMCEQAAAFLNCAFELVINGQTVNNRPPKTEK